MREIIMGLIVFELGKLNWLAEEAPKKKLVSKR